MDFRVKVEVKEEIADDDYNPNSESEDDEDPYKRSTKGKRGKYQKKDVSLTPEARIRKVREKYLRRKFIKAGVCEEDLESEINKRMVELEEREKVRKQNKGMKKKRRLRTPEQKKRESQKIVERRKLKMASMTPDEIKECKKKIWKPLTPVQKERRNKLRRERFARMTPEQLKEYCKKEYQDRKRRKQVPKTPEQLQKYNDYLRKQKERLKEYPEERQKYLAEAKEKFEKMKAEEPEKYKELRARRRKYYREVTARKLKELPPEVKEERRKRKYFRQLEKNLNMTDEEKAEKRTRAYFCKKAKQDSMSKEELEEKKRQMREYGKKYFGNLSGEKKERVRDSTKKAIQKYQKKHRDKIRAYQFKCRMNDNPEQRAKRLLGYRINQAKRLLKKKLEKDGASQEEIETRVGELVERMKREAPTVPTSQYKPRDVMLQSAMKMQMGCNPQRGQRMKSEIISKINSTKCDEKNVLDMSQFQLDEKTFDLFPCNDVSISKHSQTLYAEQGPMKLQISQEQQKEENEANLDNETFEGATFSEIEGSYDDNDDGDFGYYGVEEPEKETLSEPDAFIIPSRPIPLSTQSIPDTDLGDFSSGQGIYETNKLKVSPSSPLTTAIIATPLHSQDTPLTSMSTKSFSPVWKCPLCLDAVSSSDELSEHYKSHLEKKNIATDKTKTKRNKKKRNRAMVPIPKSVLSFFCMKCSKVTHQSTFKSKESLLSHVKRKHPKSFWPCKICNILKYSSSQLESHVDVCKKVNKNV